MSFPPAQHGRVNTVSQAEAAEEKHRFLKDFFSSAIEADSEAFSALSFAFSSTRAVFSAFA